jgi:hypothetical protein
MTPREAFLLVSGSDTAPDTRQPQTLPAANRRQMEPDPNTCAADDPVATAVLSCCTRCPYFRILSLTCGAKGTRTPGLLHAIHRQHVHQRLPPQVTVPERAGQSGQIRTGCCTFPLYRPARPARLPNERLTSKNLQEILPQRFPRETSPGLSRSHCLPQSPPAQDPNYRLWPRPLGSPEFSDPRLRLNARICRCERVPSAHAYAEFSISIRNEQCGERYVAEHWYPPLWVGQIAHSVRVAGRGVGCGA